MLRAEEVKLSELKPWMGNPRVNDKAVDAVAQSIKRFGFNVPILCDQHLEILAGHTRWMAAKRLGMQTVAVIRLDLQDGEKRAFSIADNKTAELSDWNTKRLREVLHELRAKAIPIDGIGFRKNELQQLLRATSVDENDLPGTPIEANTRRGDLWVLGKHRLLCGDSRCEDCMARLTGGRTVQQVFSGPPYFNQRSYAKWDDFEIYMSDMERIVRSRASLLADGGILVWNIGHDSRSHIDLLSHHSRLIEDAGLQYLDTIAWVKASANFSLPRNMHIRRNQIYYPAFQWEGLLVFQKPGRMPRMADEALTYMLNYQTDVWQVPAVIDQVEKRGHPAVCPVEIPYRCIIAYSEPDASVLEPFGGSGTTLVAAEKAGRTALLMERLPGYCDLAVKRWQAYTGLKGRRYRRQRDCTCTGT